MNLDFMKSTHSKTRTWESKWYVITLSNIKFWNEILFLSYERAQLWVYWYTDINWYKNKNSQVVLTICNELGSIFALFMYFYNTYSYILKGNIFILISYLMIINLFLNSCTSYQQPIFSARTPLVTEPHWSMLNNSVFVIFYIFNFFQL